MNPDSPLSSGNPEDKGQIADSKLEGPRVRFPPPFVYLVAIIIGWLIDLVVPIRVLSAELSVWLGGALIFLAISITILGFRELVRAKTTLRLDRRVSTLVTTGLFRYSRNPLYLGLAILQFSIGIWMNNAFVVLLLVPAMSWINWQVIAREERYLIGRFGQVYLDYQQQVRRWI